MAKITNLTPEQIARLKDWSEDWIKIGLSTEPANFDKAIEAALQAYKLINRDKPTIILRMSSPYGATLGGVLAWAMLRELGGSQVRSQVESQVRSQVRSQVWSQVGDAAYNYRGGSLWASWGAYVSFFRDVCGWSDPVLERFEIDEDLIRNCGWVWWHENVLAISDRPTIINRDEQGRLHSEVGPSIAYRDGWSLYHWHGVEIPASWVEDKTALDATTALTWQNIEQRRAALAMVGWPKVLRELKARVIDERPDQIEGALVEVDLPDLDTPARFIHARCGTGREFAIGVPPECNTVFEAQAWLTGLPASSFEFPSVRT